MLGLKTGSRLVVSIEIKPVNGYQKIPRSICSHQCSWCPLPDIKECFNCGKRMIYGTDKDFKSELL